MASFIKKYAVAIVFATFILVLSICDPLIPIREHSEMENRDLALFPAFSLSSFFEGYWTPKYENYVSDQFIGRDIWISIKSLCESVLLKIKNNGIIYGDDGYMFEKMESFNSMRFDKNIAFTKEFADSFNGKISFMLIPTASEILSDKLPIGAPIVPQRDKLEHAQEMLLANDNINYIDVNSALMGKHNDYIFFRTDHHWTHLGAEIAYNEFCRVNELTPIDLSLYKKVDVQNFYGSHYSKAKAWNAVPDELSWYDIPIKTLTADGLEHSTLNDEEHFSHRDKYAGLLWGNNGVTVIKSAIAPEEIRHKKILVIKDSFSHLLAGFLTENYGEVCLIDLRYFNESLSNFIEENGYEQVLILYNFANFQADADYGKIVS